MASIPDVATVRARLGVGAHKTDEELQEIIEGEAFNQAALCITPGASAVPPTTDVAPDQLRALYRRIARELAAQGVPLGLVGGEAEYGPARLPMFDAEITRLEGPTRIQVLG